jgi:pyrroline-5-carboxylate reductase
MARALARGWGDPVLVSDAGSGRARALAEELGGEAVASNLDVARRADLVVLCHKAAQLELVANEIAGEAKPTVSLLAATPLSAVRDVYPHVPLFRAMPNTPVELRRGVTCYLAAPGTDRALEQDVVALFERVGSVIPLSERLLDVAGALSSVGPAYQALVAEAQVDAAVRHGLSARVAARLVVETMGGTAALLEARKYDTLAVRREVTSPGGTTARGLAALERGGIRTAFQDALDAVRAWSAR